MSFLDTHPWRDAFIANLLERLAVQIVDQGEDLLDDAGLSFPSRSVSSLLMIGERESVSMADIAKALNQPHQLVRQRVDLLIDLGLVVLTSDPSDGRRKVLELTRTGRDQYRQLRIQLSEMKQVFANLFAEIDCDLSEIAARAMSALSQRSLVERMADLQTPAPE